MNTQQNKIEQRKLRNGKYAIEDFQDSIKNLFNISVGHFFLTLSLIVSQLFGGFNLLNVAFCLVTIVLLMALKIKLKFINREEIFFGLGFYYLLFLLEFFIAGIPDTLVPYINLDIDSKGGGVIQILNGLYPYIYLGSRLIFGAAFFFILSKRNGLEKIPIEILGRLGFQLGR